MPDRALQYRRVHNLLLLQKLLTLREGSSPFTLCLDSIEQSAKPLIKRYVHNAKASHPDFPTLTGTISKIDTIYLSYETLHPPAGVSHFIKARRKDPATIQEEIVALTNPSQRSLLVIDTLHPLFVTTSAAPQFNPSSFLSSLLARIPTTTLLAVYHTDIPLSAAPPFSSPYTPPPLDLLRYLATTVLTCHSLAQTLARKRAAERSQPEPAYGLAEEKEGIIVGLCGVKPTRIAGTGRLEEGGGVVLEAEFRRKSGRAVEEWFFLPTMKATTTTTTTTTTVTKRDDKVMLLDDYTEFDRHGGSNFAIGSKDGTSLEGPTVDGTEASTFELGITERQRRDREGVVLPYFDAQKGVLGEAGEGGRILYDLGVEDDFDEEEDEI